jgi:hypothetical protein
MMAFLQRHPLAVFLCALAAALLVVIGVQTGFGKSMRLAAAGAPTKRASPFEAKLLPPPAVASAEQAYPETAARPLFTPTRRPAPDAAPPSTFNRGQFVLQGIIVAGNTRTALLREKSSGRIHRVEQGRDIGGLKVAEIEREAVTLTQGPESEVLSLQVLKPTPTAGGGAGAGAVASAVGPFGPLPQAAVVNAPGVGQPPAPGMAGSPAGMPGLPPGTPVPANVSANAPGVANPLAPGTSASNAPAAQLPQATTSPMSPEELLARRRARRGQQSQ